MNGKLFEFNFICIDLIHLYNLFDWLHKNCPLNVYAIKNYGFVKQKKIVFFRAFVTGYLSYQVPKLIQNVRIFHLNVFGEDSEIFSLKVNCYIINVWKTYCKSILVAITELRTTIVFLIMTVYWNINFWENWKKMRRKQNRGSTQGQRYSSSY